MRGSGSLYFFFMLWQLMFSMHRFLCLSFLESVEIIWALGEEVCRFQSQLGGWDCWLHMKIVARMLLLRGLVRRCLRGWRAFAGQKCFVSKDVKSLLCLEWWCTAWQKCCCCDTLNMSIAHHCLLICCRILWSHSQMTCRSCGHICHRLGPSCLLCMLLCRWHEGI